MMLAHIGQAKIADLVKNAWLSTIEDGIHTSDIYTKGLSLKKVSTDEFAQAVIARLGSKPLTLAVSELASEGGKINFFEYKRVQKKKTLVGVDIFLDWQGSDPQLIGHKLEYNGTSDLKLKMITNRGVKVYPNGMDETYCTDHWRCRFVSEGMDTLSSPQAYREITQESLLYLLTKLHQEGFDVIKTENLYEFDGKRGFSLGQGE
jgi:isocitrate dehydrogenase